MGQSASKKSKEEKATRKQHLNTAIQNRKQDLLQHQPSTAIVSREDAVRYHTAINTGLKQLDRGGKPFTKADVVRIVYLLFVLKTGQKNPTQMEQLDHNTVEELRALARNIMYDPTLDLAPKQRKEVLTVV